MATDTKSVDKEELSKRRTPCMVAYLHPFRIVNGSESLPWNVTIDDVNNRQWDYIELHRVVGGLDVGLPAPYHMVVARDGAMGLPALPHLQEDQAAVEFYNRIFAALLLGGVYCEAIGRDGLDFASIIDWTFVRVRTSAPAAANRFHYLARMRYASAYEAISLMRPRTITIAELSKAMDTGRTLLDAVPEVSAEFVLKGTTSIARRDWGAALANLWIVVEQITSHLWQERVVLSARRSGDARRAEQLSDTRSWTVALRHELLHQTGVIPPEILTALSGVRKARNALSHRGAHPTEVNAKETFRSMLAMLQIAVGAQPIPLCDVNLSDHALSDPFHRDPPKLEGEPTHWMEILKLPGEADLERLEAERYRKRN